MLTLLHNQDCANYSLIFAVFAYYIRNINLMSIEIDYLLTVI